jgi:ammonium transporter, Amt family
MKLTHGQQRTGGAPQAVPASIQGSCAHGIGGRWTAALVLAAFAAPYLAMAEDAATATPVAEAAATATAAAAASVDTAALTAAIQNVKVAADTVWVAIGGALVFFMNAGFALLEAGLCRAKNTVNILAKNLVITAIAGLCFYAFGFGLMFGDGSPFMGANGYFLGGADNSPATGADYKGVFSSLSWATVPLEAKFFFQVCFVMTAGSIVSGAVAERIKFGAYILFSVVLCAIVYPITGHWIWGGGWAAAAGFWDFAGSAQVHTLGGVASLVGIIILGPRQGKFGKDGKAKPIPGHSMSLVAIGGFILWIGWFGFNGGSTMAADANGIAHVLTTTLLASLAGLAASLATSQIYLKTPDVTMMVNGMLAGLVAVTAPCAFVSAGSSVIIGLIAGVVVVFAVTTFDKLKIDDPVGATSVHLVCGILGTIFVGLFAEEKFNAAVGNGLFFGGGTKLLMAQLTGLGALIGFVGAISAVTWIAIKYTFGLRVPPSHELEGLDVSEMGMVAYPNDSVGHIDHPM